MKKIWIVYLILFALCLTACARDARSETDTDAVPVLPTLTAPVITDRDETEEDLAPDSSEATEPATTEAIQTETLPGDPEQSELTELFVENPAFTELAGPNCDPSILAVLYNAPFVDGAPVPTAVWNEGEYDQLVICPRWIGSAVDVWQICREYDGEEETTRLDGPVYSAICESGDCYGAALFRPEGAAAWAVSVTVPENAFAYVELNYNGRYGTPAYEFVTDHTAVVNAASQTMDPSVLSDLAGLYGEDFFYSFLRTALRRNLDPWAAMQQYCSPMSDYGDSAAYTVSWCEMDGDTCYLTAALLREGYDPGPEGGGVAERAEAQARRYAEIGNRDGILGIDPDKNDPLYFDLNGLTIYNPTLLAAEVTVVVNGEEAGTYPLNEGEPVTLLDLRVKEIPADTAIRVEVKVTAARGDVNAAILEVWPGLGGNISGAR